MGHCTKFEFKATLARAPQDIIDLLAKVFDKKEDYVFKALGDKASGTPEKGYIFNPSDVPPLPIDHAFGKCERWHQLLTGKFNPKSKRLEINADFKNYDQEIKKFCDWINPFIYTRKKKLFLGYWRLDDMNWQFNVCKINGKIQ